MSGYLHNLFAASRSWSILADQETRYLFGLLTHSDCSDWSDKIEEKIIVGHLGLVQIVLSSEYSKIIPFRGEDLFQEGIVGLIEATRRYKLEADAKFTTYARPWIRNTMSHFLKYDSGIGCRAERPLSLDSMRAFAYDGGEPTSLLTPEEYEDLHARLSRMHPRVQRTMTLYYGLSGCEPRTFEQIGLILGVSDTMARDYHRRGLEALQGSGTGAVGTHHRTMAHGTQYAYRRRGCRCVSCGDWYVNHLAEKRDRHRARRLLEKAR